MFLIVICQPCGHLEFGHRQCLWRIYAGGWRQQSESSNVILWLEESLLGSMFCHSLHLVGGFSFCLFSLFCRLQQREFLQLMNLEFVM